VVQSDYPEAEIARLWKPVVDILPRTVDALQRKLRRVALLSTDSDQFSLLYFFEVDEMSYIFRGREPLKTDEVRCPIPANFLKFHLHLHNGWIDYYSRDKGPLPNKLWQPMSEWVDTRMVPRSAARVDFNKVLIVYRTDPGVLIGCDLSKSPPRYLAWDEDRLRLIPDIWSFIDDETSEFIEQFDPNKNKSC
jgi:hypothetical protein